MICREGRDIIQDQYLVFSHDQSCPRALKALCRRGIPHTSAARLFIFVWNSCWLAGQTSSVGAARVVRGALSTASHTASESVAVVRRKCRPVESIKLECAVKKHISPTCRKAQFVCIETLQESPGRCNECIMFACYSQ